MRSKSVVVLGLCSPTSQMGGRVFWTGGLAPTITAGTHGYGFGYILVHEEVDTDECRPGGCCEDGAGGVLQVRGADAVDG